MLSLQELFNTSHHLFAVRLGIELLDYDPSSLEQAAIDAGLLGVAVRELEAGLEVIGLTYLHSTEECQDIHAELWASLKAMGADSLCSSWHELGPPLVLESKAVPT